MKKQIVFMMNWVFILLVSFWEKCSQLARNGKVIITKVHGNLSFQLRLKSVLSKENLKKFSIQLPTTDHQRLNAIIDSFINRLNESLSLDSIAQQSGISVRSLTRLFQRKLHITFVQYLKMLRIIRAMELINDTDVNMTEIAYEIGYSNISAFSNNFQQLTNMRPIEFKTK